MSKLREIRTAAKISQEKLAEMAGTSQAQIAKIEKSGKIKIDWAIRLAPYLACDPADLLEEDNYTHYPLSFMKMQEWLEGQRMEQRANASNLLADKSSNLLVDPEFEYGFNIAGLPVQMKVRGPIASQASKYISGNTDLIPVLSAARGGDEQEMFLEDGPIDWVERPSYLKNARDPYAIWVVGDSMYPRFRPAQVLHVNPYKPPAPGSGVIICKKNQAVMIKEWVGRTGDAITLREFRPEEREFQISAREVASIHTVAGLQEP